MCGHTGPHTSSLGTTRASRRKRWLATRAGRLGGPSRGARVYVSVCEVRPRAWRAPTAWSRTLGSARSRCAGPVWRCRRYLGPRRSRSPSSNSSCRISFNTAALDCARLTLLPPPPPPLGLWGLVAATRLDSMSDDSGAPGWSFTARLTSWNLRYWYMKTPEQQNT